MPYYLCDLYGIQRGKDWYPRDCWEAIKKLGIDLDDVFTALEDNKTASDEDLSDKFVDLASLAGASLPNMSLPTKQMNQAQRKHALKMAIASGALPDKENVAKTNKHKAGTPENAKAVKKDGNKTLFYLSQQEISDMVHNHTGRETVAVMRDGSVREYFKLDNPTGYDIMSDGSHRDVFACCAVHSSDGWHMYPCDERKIVYDNA